MQYNVQKNYSSFLKHDMPIQKCIDSISYCSIQQDTKERLLSSSS